MEAVGLVLAVGGLAGCFGAAVEAFDQIKAAKSFSRDYEILTRYDIRSATLFQWNMAVGVSPGSTRRIHPIQEDKSLRPVLERALNCIRMLLIDADLLQDKYGLQKVKGASSIENDLHAETDASTMVLESSFGRAGLNTLKDFHARFRLNIKNRQRSTSFIRKTQSAIVDARDFRRLRQDLDDLIEDLYKLVSVTLEEQSELFKKDASASPEDFEHRELL